MATAEKQVTVTATAEPLAQEQQPTSFWSSLTTKVSEVVDSTKAAASRTYADLSGRPTQVTCRKCTALLEIPDIAWKWKCSNCDTSNDCSTQQCVCDNQLEHPFQPVIRCGYCNEINFLSTTKVLQIFTDVGRKAATGASDLANATKTKVDELKAQPTDAFSCKYCMGSIPFEAWTCPGCTVSNKPSNLACEMCKTEKPAPEAGKTVACPVCTKDNEIPTTNMRNELNRAAFITQSKASSTYYALTGKPYYVCQRCSACHLLDSAEIQDATCPTCNLTQKCLKTYPAPPKPAATPTPVSETKQ